MSHIPALTFQPLRITAHLASGFASANPWGIALDGLLASELRGIQKALLTGLGHDVVGAMDSDNPPDLRLPLARCTLSPTWHWAATCGQPSHPDIRPEVHTWTARVDARHLEQATSYLPKTVSDRQGRYKAHRMHVLVTPATSLTWQAIGDLDAISDLLDGISAIGKKRSQGEGHVLAWEVVTVDVDEFAAAHCHPDGTLGRPTPIECLDAHPKLRTHLAMAGLRPPYMHPSRRSPAYLPQAGWVA